MKNFKKRNSLKNKLNNEKIEFYEEKLKGVKEIILS